MMGRAGRDTRGVSCVEADDERNLASSERCQTLHRILFLLLHDVQVLYKCLALLYQPTKVFLLLLSARMSFRPTNDSSVCPSAFASYRPPVGP